MTKTLDKAREGFRDEALASWTERRSYGQWELQVHGNHAELLTKLYGTWAMPMVLAVFPK